MDGITALRTLYSAQPLDRRTPVVILTAFDTDAFILDALRAGAIGFLLKTTKPEALVAAVRAGAAGQQILSPQVLPKLMAAESAGDQEEPLRKKQNPRAQRKLRWLVLSQREKEIAQLVAEGLNNSEIAQRLYISTTTVKTHIKHIMDKLEVTNRIHIAIAVLEAR
ncbi:Response regulator containing a CheY-like receiver domain and an HTH DNA-binding domain [Corynebacterium camporealensis]|nr:Response regulator containing a CheY-like receiver domain and an HTH DNA-binding domain [Corynebacterium camporealensis]